MRSRIPHPASGGGRPTSRAGFTLVEMLTVIGIIVLLVSILLPVVSAVRTKGHQADTMAMLSRIASGIESYSGEFRAYPGPLHNGQIYNSGGTPPVITGVNDTSKITQSENLVIGLLGGVGLKSGTSTNELEYKPDSIGNGPVSLNVRAPKKYRAFMDKVSLSSGDYKDDVGDADDSNIPEFVDKFPDPMPILYMRANVGANGIASDAATMAAQQQYDLKQIKAYTLSTPGKTIGVGRESPADDEFKPGGAPSDPKDRIKHGLRTVDANASSQNPPPTPPGGVYTYPYDLYGFMRHPSMANTPRQKDGYILISSGADRIYGTKDDAVYPASR